MLVSLRPDLRVARQPGGAVRLTANGRPLLDLSDEPLRSLVVALLEAVEVEDLARTLALDVDDARQAVEMLRGMGMVVDCPPPRTHAPVHAILEPAGSREISDACGLFACPSDGGRPRVGPRTACMRCFHGRRAALHPPPDDGGEMPSLCHDRFLAAIDAEGPTLGTQAWISLAPDGTRATRHAYLALPGCKTCGGTAAGLVDEGSGIFSSVDVRQYGPLYHATGHLGDVSAFAPTWNVRSSGGVGLAPDEARARAIGEGLERYCAALAVVNASQPVPWRALGRQALHPSRVPLFSPRQHAAKGFPYEPFTQDTPVRWIEAEDADGRPVQLPAALVALPYEPEPPEPWITPYLSHGLACGRTREDAVTAGLCELVERHAFTRFWVRQRRARRVRWSHPVLEAEMEARGWRVTVLDLRDDVPLPTFLAVARSASPALWIGAAAGVDAATALTRALLEVFQNHTWLSGSPPACAGSSPGTFEEHGAWYTRHPERIPLLRCLEPEGDVDVASTEASPHWRDAVGEHFACDLTTRDVALAGFSVVRVVAPALARLHADHATPFLGNARLADVRAFPPHPFP